MGYFSNGSEHEYYQNKYCSRCVHWNEETGCPIEHVHMLFNYKQLDKDQAELKTTLDILIPPVKDGIGNQECAMFHAADPNRCPDTLEMFER